MSNAKNEYINNQDFLNALVEYKKSVQESEAENKEKPQIPNYIGECFLKISRNFSAQVFCIAEKELNAIKSGLLNKICLTKFFITPIICLSSTELSVNVELTVRNDSASL